MYEIIKKKYLLFFFKFKGGILIDNSGNVTINHYVSIVGWGIENNTKYWFVRNSWGYYYGINGKINNYKTIFFYLMYEFI